MVCCLVGAGDRQVDHLGTATGADGADLGRFLLHGNRFGLDAQQGALVDFDGFGHGVVFGTDQ